MKFLISLAWKNLSRYKRRTAITVAALAVGVCFYIWIDGWLYGAEIESERNLIWYETAAAKIMNEEYWADIETFPLKHVIADPAALEARLREAAGVAVTRRTVFAGELFFGDGAKPVKMVALDPAGDGKVFHLDQCISAGSFLDDTGAGILLGEWLARDLGIRVGDPVVVRTRTRYGAFQTLDLEVAGILNSPNPVLNKGTGFVSLSAIEEAMEMEGAVTELALYFPGWKEPAARLAEIEPLLAGRPELTLLSWRDLAQDYLTFAKMKQSGSGIYLLLVFIIAAVGITNTMLMAVYERVREIGMMRALGMKNSAIRAAFLLEAGGIGLLGSGIGLALGALATFLMVRNGIDFSKMLGEMDIGYRISGVFYSAWHPPALAAGFVFGILATMVISLIPSSRALKKEITDCLRYV
jgi:putative ABC transport system permease protein